ncbi:MAG: tetratricopeptide repeat protein [Kiritimatiellia bacterium]|jgi:hypothetical protein
MKPWTLVLCVWLAAGLARAADVFEMPRLYPRHQQLAGEMRRAIQARDAEAMEVVARAGTALLPEDPTWRYNLACALSLQGKADDALEVLERAIRLGFHDVGQIDADTDLATIHANPRFDELLELAATLAAAAEPAHRPFPVKDGPATVDSTNSVWNYSLGQIDVFFAYPTNGLPAVTNPVVNARGPAGDAVRAWFEEGTASGNRGDLYDNRDRDHSRPALKDFPWLSYTRYSAEAKARDIHGDISAPLLFHGPRAVVGNSSTAQMEGPFWRSNARALMSDPHRMQLLFYAYFRNHLYVYPAVIDFDAARAGDAYLANTPYTINTVGASWSDRPVVEACLLSLAAMRPEVKDLLFEKGLLAPTLQWAFRSTQNCVTNREDYLSAAAHPPAFGTNALDTLRMVTLCHGLTTNSLPPVVLLEVVEETLPRPAPDTVDHLVLPEVLFTTPQAIARIARSTDCRRRMVVSAAPSQELCGRPLRWHWKLLRGDPAKTTITPLDGAGSRAEILVDYQPRAPIAPGSDLLGCRVDIGVFADNGERFSAPAFISVCFAANEIRAYSADGRILSIDGETLAGTYADPFVFPVRRWIDIYHYDSKDRLVGWTRTRNGESEAFAWNGALVETTDDVGRPLAARGVRYRFVQGPEGVPELAYEPAPVRIAFAYDAPGDRIGRIVRRERLPDAPPAEPAEGPTGE